MFSTFLSAFVAIFVVVDPLGTATVFAALTGAMNDQTARRTALKAVTLAIGVLLVFSILGQALLRLMGISLPAFHIAGGVLIFITSFRMIMGSHDNDQLNSTQSTYADRSHLAIFPLAIPFLAGPGCMTAALLNMTNAQALSEKASVIIAILLVEVIALIGMLCAHRLVKAMGPGGASLIARLMGILLAAMAVQFVADGINGFIS